MAEAMHPFYAAVGRAPVLRFAAEGADAVATRMEKQ